MSGRSGTAGPTMHRPQAERMPRAELVQTQLAALRTVLRRIQVSNPHYACRLVGAPELRSLSDLRRLPFLTKNDLRLGYPLAFACAPRSALVRLHASSGTTGDPVLCPYTARDVETWAEIMARCLTAAGVTPDDVVQATPAFGLFNGGFGFHYGASALNALLVPSGPGRTQLQLKLMRDLRTTVLASLASYPLRLMEVAEQEGFDFRRDTSLRVGVLGGEVWSDQMRGRIERAMGIETFDIMGFTEAGGVGMGIDCHLHDGIHVWEDHFVVEIVDSDGEAVDDGEWGEMVVTTLRREALPLVRFRTGDITRLVSREPCRCGRTSLRVDRIASRSGDVIKVKGVNFHARQIESVLLGHSDVGHDYLIEIDRVSGADRVKLRAESDVAERERLIWQLGDELRSLLGLSVAIELVPVGTLSRSEGKAVRVRDNRV